MFTDLNFVYLSHGYSSAKAAGLRGAALAPDACGVMSISPKWAELLLHIVSFYFLLWGLNNPYCKMNVSFNNNSLMEF